MKHRTVSALVLTICLAPALAAAQVDHPGYFAVEDIDIFASGMVETDIDLKSAMIRMVAAAAEQQDPDFAELVSEIERIRVRVGPLDEDNREAVVAAFARAGEQLVAAGWQLAVKIDEEEDEQIRLFLKEIDGEIEGMTVLVNDGFEEGVVVNIAGRIDPRLIGKLGALEGLPLEELLSGAGGYGESEGETETD